MFKPFDTSFLKHTHLSSHRTVRDSYPSHGSPTLLGFIVYVCQLPLCASKWCFIHKAIWVLCKAIMCLWIRLFECLILLRRFTWCISTLSNEPQIAHGAPCLDRVSCNLHPICSKGFLEEPVLTWIRCWMSWSGPVAFRKVRTYDGSHVFNILFPLGLGILW
jgi:hypothetical protein